MSIRVLLIEDHQIFRIGLKYVLDQSEGIRVVGEACDLASGVQALRGQETDVVVLDLDLPDGSGVDLLRTITAEAGRASVLVVSGYDGNDWAGRVLGAGAHGFVDKGAEFTEIVAAVRAVHAGRRMVSIAENGQMLRRDEPAAAIGAATNADEPRGRAEAPPLSDREREVLGHIARGRTNQQTADELYLSVKTVETYRSRLMKKLGLSARSELFEYARQAGLLTS